jgi:hypothetical protein
MLLNGLGFTGRTLHMYSEFFDDKPVSRLIDEGIEALEHTIREQLKAQDEFFLDMKKKPTQTPTVRWVFHGFAGIDLLTINDQQMLLLNIKDRGPL